eukprot:621020-Pyramimonas_sp.AAC.2
MCFRSEFTPSFSCASPHAAALNICTRAHSGRLHSPVLAASSRSRPKACLTLQLERSRRAMSVDMSRAAMPTHAASL